MSKKSKIAVEDDEQVLVSGNRRVFPGVEIYYRREEDWSQGRVYVSICRDSECMTIDQFEIFIAMFTKVIEIARRKEQETGSVEADNPCLGDMPQVEMNYDSACAHPETILFNISENGRDLSIALAERFLALMQNLLAESRKIERVAV